MMTQCLSSHDPIEKSNISHSYVSVSSSEDAGVGHGGDILLELNASVMVMQAAMRVYMFYSREFCAPVMSPFFRAHQPFDDITLDDIRPYFQPPRYLTDGESDSDTRLTPTVSLDFDSSEPSYPSYHVESDPSEPFTPQ